MLRGWRSPTVPMALGRHSQPSIPERHGNVARLHKIRNVLDKVPEKLKGDVHRKLREILWLNDSCRGDEQD